MAAAYIGRSPPEAYEPADKLATSAINLPHKVENALNILLHSIVMRICDVRYAWSPYYEIYKFELKRKLNTARVCPL